jgi:hypothetical protein
MTWTDYFVRHAEEAERKAQLLSGHAREKQGVVAATFRSLARDHEVIEGVHRRSAGPYKIGALDQLIPFAIQALLL